MTDSYRALCTDFYVNQKLSVKLDLPNGRESTLDMFERVKRQFPAMNSFRRYRDELALETGGDPSEAAGPHRWLAVRSSNIRSGVVNPLSAGDATDLHKAVLEVAPFFLSISPLDVEYLEILFGFDLAAGGNQDRLVAEALLQGSPMAGLLETDAATPVEFQPLLGFIMSQPDADVPLGGGDHAPPFGDTPSIPGRDEERPTTASGVEVHFEIKTRSGSEAASPSDPISVYLTLRSYEPVDDLKHLPAALDALATRGTMLIDDAVIPSLLVPIRDAISGSAS